MLEKYLGAEIVIHGAAMFKRWDLDRPMALVGITVFVLFFMLMARFLFPSRFCTNSVSDWDEGFLDEFIAALSHDQHPFHEVVIMRPPGVDRIHHRLLVGAAEHGITIRTVERESNDFMDVSALSFSSFFLKFDIAKYLLIRLLLFCFSGVKHLSSLSGSCK